MTYQTEVALPGRYIEEIIVRSCPLADDKTDKENLQAVTNETGPLPLCTFSVMGLSMCSSIFSESSPVRSKSGIINELSGLGVGAKFGRSFLQPAPLIRLSPRS